MTIFLPAAPLPLFDPNSTPGALPPFLLPPPSLAHAPVADYRAFFLQSAEPTRDLESNVTLLRGSHLPERRRAKTSQF